MVITSSPLTIPSPKQDLHLSVIVWPSPPQLGQTVVVCIWPSMVFCMRVTCPAPLHVEQVAKAEPFFAPLPLQVSHFMYLLT